MEENNTKSIKGIKIRSLNLLMIFLACILYLLLIYATFYASHYFSTLVSATEQFVTCEHNADLVQEYSDYLTEQTRLYTLTKDPEYLEAYFREILIDQHREHALEALSSHHAGDEAFVHLQGALDASNGLIEQEVYAMMLSAASSGYDLKELLLKLPLDIPPEIQNMELPAQDLNLTSKELSDKAREIVFGASYQESKLMIETNITYFLTHILDTHKKLQSDSTQDLKKTLTRQQILISVLFVENVLTFIMIIQLIVKPLQIYVSNIKDEKKLEIIGSYEFKYLALTYNSIYELNVANEATLRYQAEHDPLTGIINRGAFEHLKQFFQSNPKPLAFLIIDVDKFKLINDGYGHEIGDMVLKLTYIGKTSVNPVLHTFLYTVSSVLKCLLTQIGFEKTHYVTFHFGKRLIRITMIYTCHSAYHRFEHKYILYLRHVRHIDLFLAQIAHLAFVAPIAVDNTIGIKIVK